MLAFVLRAGWAVTRPSDEASLARLPDQMEYLQLGRNLLHAQRLEFFDPRFEQTVVAFRLPGYPVFVAACAGDARFVRAAQAVIDTLTVLTVYLLARRWLSGRAALFAAFLAAVNPWLIYFTGLILSETLFAAMLAWGMVLLARRQTLLAGAALLACGAWVRAEMAVLAIVLTAVAAWMHHGRLRALHGAVLAGIFVWIALVPWAWRNHTLLHRWVWTSTNNGFTLYDGFNPNATGASDQAFCRQWPDLRQQDEIHRNQLLIGLALQWMEQHPARDMQLAGLKIARTWSPTPLSSEYAKPLYVTIATLYAVPLDVLALWALWRIARRRSAVPPRAALFLLAPAICITLIHAATIGSLRYRVPLEAMTIVLVASAIVPSPGNPGEG